MPGHNGGREPRQKPDLAFDYRRYMTLVQVLSMPESEQFVAALCEKWDVPPAGDTVSTIRVLAQHVMAYHRREKKG